MKGTDIQDHMAGWGGYRGEPGHELLTPTNILPCGQTKVSLSRLVWPGEERTVGRSVSLSWNWWELPAFRTPERPVAWRCGEEWDGPSFLLYPTTSLQKIPSSAPFKNVQLAMWGGSCWTCLSRGSLGLPCQAGERDLDSRAYHWPAGEGLLGFRSYRSYILSQFKASTLTFLFFLSALFCSEFKMWCSLVIPLDHHQSLENGSYHY